jgi:HAD superfamily phosphoserine phosphatase-like hydrolase
MISVIIPALNEEQTITQVVTLSFSNPLVTEVLVVDDKSLDATVEEAKKAGARVITSTKLGKGASMRDGLMVAKNEIIVFLDADIATYPTDLISRMTTPLIDGDFDFVKSFFTRQAGRVTELVAKPLLSILIPEFPSFIQPLSGIIAGKKTLFSKIDFQDGYGVDIGILIDVFKMGARIAEIDIGNIENKMQALGQLGKMSREVANVILEKADRAKRGNLETLEHIQVIREQMEFAITERAKSLKKLAVIDMDRTLLSASFIQTCAHHFDFKAELLDIISSQPNAFLRTKQIARLLKGRTVNDLISVAESIPFSANLDSLLYKLREKGYSIGIITDSYDYVANYYVNKLRLDFSLANELEFSKSVVTGEVKIPSFFLPHQHSICSHDICKTHSLIDICKTLGVELENTIAIGDGENDICMIKKSGIGIAYCASHPTLNLVADFVITEPDMRLAATYIE